MCTIVRYAPNAAAQILELRKQRAAATDPKQTSGMRNLTIGLSVTPLIEPILETTLLSRACNSLRIPRTAGNHPLSTHPITRQYMVDRIYVETYITFPWKFNTASFFAFCPMTRASVA